MRQTDRKRRIMQGHAGECQAPGKRLSYAISSRALVIPGPGADGREGFLSGLSDLAEVLRKPVFVQMARASAST